MPPSGSNNSNLLSPDIEQIVQLVLQRLRSQLPAPSAPLAPALGAAAAQTAPPSAASSSAVLRIDQRLLTMVDLRERLSGIQQVEVSQHCVVTPAVQDELRYRGIRLQRNQGVSQAAAANLLQSAANRNLPLAHCCVVVPGGSKLAGLARLLATEGASVRGEAETCQRTAELVRDQLQATGGVCLWSAQRPFAAVSAMAALRLSSPAVQLSALDELSAAVEQAQPHTLIVDDQRWSLASLSRLVRQWCAVQPARSAAL